jgi:hypothetical protein
LNCQILEIGISNSSIDLPAMASFYCRARAINAGRFGQPSQLKGNMRLIKGANPERISKGNNVSRKAKGFENA